jgi:hypothetical protein
MTKFECRRQAYHLILLVVFLERGWEEAGMAGWVSVIFGNVYEGRDFEEMEDR